MANKLVQVFKKFVELLTPEGVSCVNCGREIFEGSLCTDCKKEFFKNDKKRCKRCSRPTVSVDDVVCEQCKQVGEVYYDQAFSPLVYTGVALALVRKYKYHERRDIGKFLSEFMVEEFSNIPEVDYNIPVPMWRGKRKDRLYSTADELSQYVGSAVGLKVMTDIVEKTRDTGSQTELSGTERLQNVKGSFKVAKRVEVRGKRILVIDDVFTTGATVDEIARVLKGAKADKVYVLTSAIAVKHKE